jgi:hypothetical protein
MALHHRLPSVPPATKPFAQNAGRTLLQRRKALSLQQALLRELVLLRYLPAGTSTRGFYPAIGCKKTSISSKKKNYGKKHFEGVTFPL